MNRAIESIRRVLADTDSIEGIATPVCDMVWSLLALGGMFACLAGIVLVAGETA